MQLFCYDCEVEACKYYNNDHSYDGCCVRCLRKISSQFNDNEIKTLIDNGEIISPFDVEDFASCR